MATNADERVKVGRIRASSADAGCVLIAFRADQARYWFYPLRRSIFQ